MPQFASTDGFCFATTHDPWLVGLAVLVAVLASFTALQVSRQVAETAGLPRLAWLCAAAAAIGGGIWAMHFIAMLSFTLPVYVAYDIPQTVASLAIAIVVAGIGLGLNAQRSAGRLSLLGGGLIMGLGVAAMHYSGMAAMRMPARILYDPWLFALSIAIAVVAATVALHLAFRRLSTRRIAIASLVMALAIAGMHFTGMWAASFVPLATEVPMTALTTPRAGLAVLIAVGTSLILGIEFASAVLHRRFDALTRREAEALMRSEERLRALVENSSDLIFLVDAEGRIDYAAAGRLGLDSRLLRDWEFLSLFGAGNRRILALALEELVQGDGARATGSTRLIDAQGRQRDFDFVGTDLRAHPAIQGFVFTLYDVTERAEAERQMLRAQTLAEQASRAKSQFITNMSHELRTPLNAVIGFSEILESEAFGPLGNARYKEYAADIHRSGEHLLGVVNDLLDIGKIEAGEIALQEQDSELAELVERARAIVAATAETRGIAIEVALEGNPVVHGDSAKLRQILINLLSNAVKFSADGGRVLVASHRRADGDLAVSIADQGIGIAAGDLERIWLPFVQADGSLSRRYEGSGLGLPVARGLAELHGGRLELASEPGVGTTVTLVLPAARLQDAEPLPIAAL